eukprot:5131620-Pyramimonas_sp.AAC.1
MDLSCIHSFVVDQTSLKSTLELLNMRLYLFALVPQSGCLHGSRTRRCSQRASSAYATRSTYPEAARMGTDAISPTVSQVKVCRPVGPYTHGIHGNPGAPPPAHILPASQGAYIPYLTAWHIPGQASRTPTTATRPASSRPPTAPLRIPYGSTLIYLYVEP